MSRWAMLWVLMLVLLAAAVPSPASAQAMDFDQYRDAMLLFSPEVDEWTVAFEELAVATMIKPEMRCGQELQDLAERGRRMAGDLAGTAELAPSALRPDHDAITGAVANMAEVAADACGTKGSLLALTKTERDASERALRHLNTVLELRRPVPRELPPLPRPSLGGVPDAGAMMM